jgi:crotonobetainyl-CoA:carnitine CoA-transferase CaiB-like acyl-CoA transferase
MLELKFAHEPADHWLQQFNEVGVPCAPINTYSGALNDPQVQALGLVQSLELPGGTSTKTVVSPIRMDGVNAGVRLLPPELGAHTEEVFAELDAR